MNTADIMYELGEAQTTYEETRTSMEDERMIRNELVKAALQAGVRPVDVAKLTGLTRARIAQLQ